MKRLYFYGIAFCSALALAGGCAKKGAGSANGAGGSNPPAPGPTGSDLSAWVTSSDGNQLLQPLTTPLNFGTTANSYPNIDIDTAQTFQTVDGFGYTLTGGSAGLLQSLPAGARQTLLRELFSSDDGAIAVNYLRISIGASDLSASVYSYDDLPAGQTDPTLQHFSIAAEEQSLLPLLQQIRSINPSLQLLASPWSPPAWMKDNGSSVGGSLLPQFYGAYAQYFVKYLQAMQQRGLPVQAITVQNEPLHGGNNPSMVMTAAQQADFVKNHLGPAFQAAGITTKIIIWDHNCDRPDYPLNVLADAAAKAFVDGSAFHLYAGDISALSQVHNAHPDRNIYFTEQYTASNGSFGGDLRWHLRNVIIGSMRNWSRNALEWNLANDLSFGPHTPGGCDVCKGALTISGSNVTRNVSYYIIAQASRFVTPGSVRIQSGNTGNLYSVAFRRPDGKKVLLVLNDGGSPQAFNIRYGGRWAATVLNAGSAATFVW
ncbi:glycoside hydrolase family 30 protein [Flaviaesturariibacter aridisoli]|uniref:Glucosylceramidase n=1 Tax=Flaviaesturariibacter aridisoli TaxID=2545761 RepID=A0A4R4E2X0_9BACT|nr:glycoside hydrolase family 30 beta sandwich domain-containing protein [Flaviaesturariibacter aridisoli]TCZ72970.1 glucosylceramidase [Flaviaesturariibacter aridisoli]